MMAANMTSLLVIERREVGEMYRDTYLRPPAPGEVLAMSEKHLLDSISGGSVASFLHEGKPLNYSGLSDSGRNFDVRERLQSSDGSLSPRSWDRLGGSPVRDCVVASVGSLLV